MPKIKLKLIFFLVLTFVIVCDGKKRVNVGAILDEDSHDTEVAFKYAIDRINMYEHNIEFVPLIQKVAEIDSFKAKKIACNMTQQGVAAIFGPLSLQTTGIVESIASNFEIPNLQVHWDPKPRYYSSKMALNFYPSIEILSKGIVNFIRKLDWKGFTIIYQDDDALYRLQELLKDHGPSDSPVTLRQLPEDTRDFRSLLKEIQVLAESHIVLDCDAELIPEILNQAKEVNLLQEYHSYVLLSLDAHTVDFGDLQYALSNITAFRLIDPASVEVRNAVRDWEQGELRQMRRLGMTDETVPTEAAIMYDAVNYFAKGFAELDGDAQTINPEPIACGEKKVWEHGFRIIEYLKVKQHQGLTGPIEFDSDNRRVMFNLQIIELTNKGLNDIGYLDTVSGEVIITRKFEDEYSAVTESIQNKTFKVSSRIGPPYLMHRTPGPGEVLKGNDRYEGYSMDLIDEIARDLHFKYEFHLVYDTNYGKLDPETGKWNGIIQEILDRRADLGICDLTINQERRSAVDFTPPFMTLGISILFSKEEKKPIEQFAFLKPFSFEVWVYTATAFVGMALCMLVIARLSPKDWENPHPCDQNPEELENIWDVKNAIWLILGSIMTQGCDILPKASATRLCSAAWWFFTMIMVSSYTANLAACLTNENLKSDITSAEDLVSQSKVKYGAVETGSTASFLKKSNYTTYKKIWTVIESTKPSVFVKENADGVERVKKSKHEYAFFMESSSIEYEIEKDCNLQQIGGLLDSKGYGIAMPFDSPYRTPISKSVLHLQERGILQKLKTRWWKEKNTAKGSCGPAPTEVTKANELGVKHVMGVFLVLGCGCGLAVFIGIIEFLWNVRKVTVENMISPWEALWCELKFALNIFIVTKPVNTNASESGSKHSSESGGNKSIAASVLRSASSFLRLDNVFEKN